MEGLDGRTLFCAPPPLMPTLGSAVPWLTPPITAATPTGAPLNLGGAPTMAAPSPRVLASSPAPIRINAGGPAYTDPNGVNWAADRSFSGGTPSTTAFAVANTTADPLYYDRRWGAFSYNIPIATAGTYTLKLHFSDPLYTTAGKRVFSVKAEGGTILNNFDIAANGGGKAALVKTFNVNVSDGTLNLQFLKNIENPVLSGIEVIAQTTVPPSPPPTTGGFTKLTYTTKASSGFPTAESLTAKSGTRMYVFGGFNMTRGPVTRSEYYDTADNTWHTIANLPQPMTHVGVAQDDQNVYFVGGYIGKGDGTGYQQTFGSNKVWIYNFASNSYSSLPNLPKPLAGGGAALIGSKLHYFGGYNLDRTDTKIHLVLDLNNLAAGWQNAAQMLHGRSHLASVVFNGKIYAIAGQVGNDAGLTTLNYNEVFDPAIGQWSSMAPMPQSISHMASASFVMDDRIIVMGGETAHNVPTRAVYAYTPATNSWQALTLLPAAKFSGVANTFNGKIFFAQGGSDGQSTCWMATPG